jgi:hypothetical protein
MARLDVRPGCLVHSFNEIDEVLVRFPLTTQHVRAIYDGQQVALHGSACPTCDDLENYFLSPGVTLEPQLEILLTAAGFLTLQATEVLQVSSDWEQWVFHGVPFAKLLCSSGRLLYTAHISIGGSFCLLRGPRRSISVDSSTHVDVFFALTSAQAGLFALASSLPMKRVC